MLPCKAQFYKIAKPYMSSTYELVTLFDTAMQHMITNTESNGLSFPFFNKAILLIGYSLDKILLSVLGCGFNPLELQQEEKIELKLLEKYTEKVNYYISLLGTMYKQSLQKPEEAQALSTAFNLFCKFLSGILYQLSEIQSSEPVIMYQHLNKLLSISLTLLSVDNQTLFPEKLQKVCLLIFNRVLNTQVYNEREIKSSGIIVSPVKYKQHEEFMIKARTQFKEFFIPTTVATLFDLIVSRYLPLKEISLWKSDPEAFIEQEDDSFGHEFDTDLDSSLSFLAYSVLEQLLQNFPSVCEKQVKKYIENITSGKLESLDILLQDAMFNAIEMLPKIYRGTQIGGQALVTPELFMGYLELIIGKQTNEINGNILKRRYIILVTKWLDLINSNI